MRKEYTIQIIGGGILGMLIAFRAAQFGYSVCVFRISHSKVPDADSQRNHAWLQSGLLYLGKISKESRWQMRQSGIRLLETFGVSPPSECGIFGLASEADAEALLAEVSEMKLAPRFVNRLDEQEAEHLLGSFYNAGHPYFRVPDVPFDEGYIMSQACKQAKQMGVRFVDMDEPVRLHLDNKSPCGLVVGARENLTASQVIILAAGSRTGMLLNQIGIYRDLVVSQSPLLVTPGPGPLKVPLFVDCSSGLTVVRHLPYLNRRDGCLVIGNRYRRNVDPLSANACRELTEEDIHTITKLLPACLRDGIISNPGTRYTAGNKTEFCKTGSGCTVEPWVDSVTEFPGLFAALPGKATTSLITAERVLDRVVQFLGKPNEMQLSGEVSYRGADQESIFLHHEDYYQNLNDAA